MTKIQVLDEQTIDKIAAGEVVERPSSVVKELAENAVDAKSTAVTVEIQEGGISLIRVTDNGCGIEKEQVPVAFFRHSTSKIRSVEDLATISSLGFRGEALSSIAAVSQVELITKTADALSGCRYLIEGGEEISLEEAGAPGGTTFRVKNLFYNTPARRKFLKAPQTEAGHVSDVVERIALSHPDISFKFINNGQIRLHTSGNSQLRDTIYHIYGRDITANLLEVQADLDGFSVSGFIGKPGISRGNRNYESYFINGRYVKSRLIAKAIEDGYHGFMMQHKYPFTVLMISLDGTRVDVNVHPNKMELRFSDSEDIYRQLVNLICDTLRGREMIADVPLGKEERGGSLSLSDGACASPDNRAEGVSPGAGEQFDVSGSLGAGETSDASELPGIGETSDVGELSGIGETPGTGTLPGADVSPAIASQHPDAQQARIVKEPMRFAQDDGEAPMLSQEARPRHKIIGQLFGTYWLVEFEERFYMIDQHAAHEKVLFEETMRNYHEKEFSSQLVAPPIVLSLTMQEENLLNRYQSDFEKLGFSIEPFGGKEYRVSAVPANLYGLNGQSLLLGLIDELGNLSDKDTPEIVAEKIAVMSCRAAVKGNHSLSYPEVEKLIDDLLKLENPYFCPHGRPVIISMTRYEIEKKFKRVVS